MPRRLDFADSLNTIPRLQLDSPSIRARRRNARSYSFEALTMIAAGLTVCRHSCRVIAADQGIALRLVQCARVGGLLHFYHVWHFRRPAHAGMASARPA